MISFKAISTKGYYVVQTKREGKQTSNLHPIFHFPHFAGTGESKKKRERGLEEASCRVRGLEDGKSSQRFFFWYY